MTDLRVAAVQLSSSNDLAANLATIGELVGRAAGEGARLIVLPECSTFLGLSERDKLAIAEPIAGDGPTLRALRELAVRHGVYLVTGGIPERIPGDADHAFNASSVIAPGGDIVATYRKWHLFDIDIPGGATLKESATTRAGDELVCVDIDGTRVGVTICYDLRFPELYRRLTLERGAQVLLVTAAFTAHTGQAHWHTLLRARAIENQCYVVAAAQWGKHNAKRVSYGHSIIYDAWGTVLGEKAAGDGVVTATLSADAQATVRAQLPCLTHVRAPSSR